MKHPLSSPENAGRPAQPCRESRPGRAVWRQCAVGLVLTSLLGAGCSAPIGADRVSTRQAYAQVEANALRSGRPSASTVALLHRHDLDVLAHKHPDEAVRRLHEIALATGERDLLFALADLSYAAAEQIRRGVQPWDPRDAREFYLGSAVYAWLFLFGEARDGVPGPYDRRFRAACDFYNYSLGLALTGRRSTNGVVQLDPARRRLPVGELEIQLRPAGMPTRLEEFEQFLLADQYRVRGLSVRNREPGIGTPLIGLMPMNEEFGVRPSAPVTALLRGPQALAEIAAAPVACELEFYTSFDELTVTIGEAEVPLEIDLTTFRAYTLNQSTIWKLGPLQFLAPAERIPSQLILNQTFDPGRIPVVFVHGTFSSPVTWAEMINTLTSDPELRRRYQVWTYLYGSGNPLITSMGNLRQALADTMRRLDPEGTNVALRQMVVIGHSQGGLLTKATAITTGDRIWRQFTTNRLEDLEVSEEDRAELQRIFFWEPLPFVRRLVFIATPHRGSYLSGSFTRRLAQRLVSFPSDLVARGSQMLRLARGSAAGEFIGDRHPTSLDGMSPKNPGLLAMSEIPIAPSVKAHSIVAIRGDDQPPDGVDGLVAYGSAHLEGMESEFIVRSFHTCLERPATIEEVRRILHEHLRGLPSKE